MAGSIEGDNLRREMAQVRTSLRLDAQKIAEKVRGIMDWRPTVKKYTWVALLGAGTLGYALVPRRRRALELSGGAIGELGRGGLSMIAAPTSPSGVAVSLAKTLGQMAVRASLAYLAQRASQKFLDHNTADANDTSSQPR
jgi:hypothetical protein